MSAPISIKIDERSIKALAILLRKEKLVLSEKEKQLEEEGVLVAHLLSKIGRLKSALIKAQWWPDEFKEKIELWCDHATNY